MLYKNILFINFILPVVSFNTVFCMTIFQAASKGDLASMQTLLEQNIYVNQVNERGESPLHIASKNGRFQLVDYLLKHGANIRLKDLYGRIALHYAVLNDHVYITEQLLKYTSNPNEQDDFGFSPLHLALELPQKDLPVAIMSGLENKKYDIIKLLLHYGAWVDLPIQSNTKPDCLYLGQTSTQYHFYTPLIYALKQKKIKQYTSLVRLLIAYSANKEIKASDGSFAPELVSEIKDFHLWYMIHYPLHEAVMADDSYCVERLLKRYNPQFPDNFGRPALILTIQESKVEEILRQYNQRKLTK